MSRAIAGLDRDERYTLSHLHRDDWLFPRDKEAADRLVEKGLARKRQKGYGPPRYLLTRAGDRKIDEVIEGQSSVTCCFCDGLWFVRTVNGEIDEGRGIFCVNPECCLSENSDPELWRAARRFAGAMGAALNTEKPERRNGSVAVSYPWGRDD